MKIKNAFVAGVFILGVTQVSAASYTLTDLGNGQAIDINELGQVVGGSYLGPTLWNGTTPTFLSGFGGTIAAATATNDTGLVVGYSFTLVNPISQAFLWNGTTTTSLGNLDGLQRSSWAWGVNNSGQVVGSISADHNGNQAILWNGITPTVLGGLGGTTSAARAINEAGQVVGMSTTIGNAVQAVHWNGTTPVVLGSLGGTNSIATGNNNAGQAVGSSQTTGNTSWQAVLWNGTTPTALSGLGGTQSEAEDINNVGQVVGYSYTASGAMHAAMWEMQNGSMVLTDLNTLIDPALGFTLAGANAINDKGQIVGLGYNSLGQQEAFILSVAVVPEPATYAMMLAGLGLLGFVRFRSLQMPTSL